MFHHAPLISLTALTRTGTKISRSLLGCGGVGGGDDLEASATLSRGKSPAGLPGPPETPDWDESVSEPEAFR